MSENFTPDSMDDNALAQGQELIDSTYVFVNEEGLSMIGVLSGDDEENFNYKISYPRCFYPEDENSMYDAPFHEQEKNSDIIISKDSIDLIYKPTIQIIIKYFSIISGKSYNKFEDYSVGTSTLQ